MHVRQIRGVVPGTRLPRSLRRFAGAASLAALSLAATASPADAAVTIGQLGLSPGTCSPGIDIGQSAVSSGASYTVPGTGTITSWSHLAISGPGQSLTMKVFRKVGDPDIYRVVGHDGPQPLSAGGLLNTFPANIPVQPGDILGINTSSPGIGCVFPGSLTDTILTHAPSNLADGEAASFTAGPLDRTNVSAVFNPANAFILGGTARNKKKGTATLNFTLPNPGELTASGKGVKAASAERAVISKSVGAGPAQFLIKAKGKQRKKLKTTGKVKLNVAITYTPTGGDPSTQSAKVKLKKKL